MSNKLLTCKAQRELGVSFNKVGDVLCAQGDLAGALSVFRKTQEILQRQAESDATNAAWQRELGVSYLKTSRVLAATQDLPTALALAHKCRDIWTNLVERSPDNAGWRQELEIVRQWVAQLEQELK